MYPATMSRLLKYQIISQNPYQSVSDKFLTNHASDPSQSYIAPPLFPLNDFTDSTLQSIVANISFSLNIIAVNACSQEVWN